MAAMWLSSQLASLQPITHMVSHAIWNTVFHAHWIRVISRVRLSVHLLLLAVHAHRMWC